MIIGLLGLVISAFVIILTTISYFEQLCPYRLFDLARTYTITLVLVKKYIICDRHCGQRRERELDTAFGAVLLTHNRAIHKLFVRQ